MTSRRMGGAACTTGALSMALAAGVVVRGGVAFVTLVSSESMTPTLLPGRRVLTRRLATSRPLRRGDVVVVESDELARVVVKRVVGLGGEQVVVTPAGGVTVDRKVLVEPYVMNPCGPQGAFDVPVGHVLLLGDDRARSNDSRTWRTPCLPVTKVLGRVVLRAPS
ncbi:Signal peptidase I U [Nocardioides aquaticus]|uniref:Signal peptidase I n=2 Tax=Nocardioides aquaticus TaxID=160826 RepID=A0ABX8EKV2_9ACTN|nr:signal peptidase I [Nocardioides aquaticus]QVT81162.1 Signal peptidase I U [Nocardioides aquaticus]